MFYVYYTNMFKRFCVALSFNISNKLQTSYFNTIIGWTRHSHSACLKTFDVTNANIYTLQPKSFILFYCTAKSNVISRTKHFHYENIKAHAVFENNDQYFTYLAPTKPDLQGVSELSLHEFDIFLSRNWMDNTSTEVYDAFRTVTLHILTTNIEIDISHDKFDNLSQSIVKHSPEFGFEQLYNLVRCLSVWNPTESTRSHNFQEVWNALDQACINNLKEWTVAQTYQMCDSWYQLGLGGICSFNWRALNKLSRRTNRLTPQQLVLALFFINLRRTFPPGMDVIDYQVSLEQCVDRLSVDELGVCAMGFFKTQKKVYTPRVLEAMIAKATAGADTVHPVILAAILKVCRSSLPVELVDQLYGLLSAVKPRIPQLPLICCLHVALAGTNVQMVHVGVTNAALQRFLEEKSLARIKDLERFSFVLSMFNWPSSVPGQASSNIYEILAEEASRPEREKEISKHPRCLANFLHYLSCMGTYPLPLIDKCLSMNFIRNVYSSAMQSVGGELLCLDVAVEIEHPEYVGNKLDPKTRRHLAKCVSMHPKKWENLDDTKCAAGDRQLKDMIAVTLKYVKDPSKLHICHVLPNYFRPDIVLRLKDEFSKEMLPIPESIRQAELGEIRRPQEPGKYICFVPASWNLIIRGTSQPIGSITQKLRLLRKIGYLPALVPWNEWQMATDKVGYLEMKIRECLTEESPSSLSKLKYTSI